MRLLPLFLLFMLSYGWAATPDYPWLCGRDGFVISDEDEELVLQLIREGLSLASGGRFDAHAMSAQTRLKDVGGLTALAKEIINRHLVLKGFFPDEALAAEGDMTIADLYARLRQDWWRVYCPGEFSRRHD